MPLRPNPRFVRLAFFVLLGAVLSSGRADAVGSCSQSTIPAIIVGCSSGTLLPPTVGYLVVAKNAGGGLLAAVPVTLDFTDTPVANFRLYNAQNAGTTVNCPARTLTITTNAAGQARFGPRFGGVGFTPTVDVIVDGTTCADVAIFRSTDADQVGAHTGLGDLALFAERFIPPGTFCSAAVQEVDYDLDGKGACLADFAIFASEYLGVFGGIYCP